MNKARSPFLFCLGAALLLPVGGIHTGFTQESPTAEPAEISPPTDTPPGPQEVVTQIDAAEGASFNSKDRIVEFRGHVRVTDPRFQLVCDKLIVYLTKPVVPAAAGKPAPAGTPPAPANATPSGGSGIDRVIAAGHVIILQKRPPAKTGEEEKITVGRGNEATFDNKTGDMTLKGMPSIEQNGNLHRATSPETIMIIRRDSSLNSKGPTHTDLIQRKGGSNLEFPGTPGGGSDSRGRSPASRSPAPSGTPSNR